MFRTISAALLAVSVLAAPALAGAPGKPFETTQHVRTTQPAPVIKALPGSDRLMNANARMGRHYHRHHRFHHRHHRHHRHWW